MDRRRFLLTSLAGGLVGPLAAESPLPRRSRLEVTHDLRCL
jgi:hypothetical protein